MTGWLSVWSVSRMRRMSQEMAPSPSAPETEMLLDVMFGRVILVTFAPCHAGRGRGRGGAQFRAIITGQRLAEFNKTTISWSGGIFDRENTKHLSQIAVVFFARVLKLWCWSWISHWDCWPLRNNAANYKRICPEMFRECLIWDVLRCIGRSHASIARTKLSVTHNFDELSKLSQQQWH